MKNGSIAVNGPAIGIILKELVRRAMVTIRRERTGFEATEKLGYGGKMDDVFTSADTKAQAIFEKSIKECLPGVGIVGEENLSLPCTIPGRDVYITIDPLDGTKAFVRRQSHGTATMVALVDGDEIISAWIGDVNTLEIYGYRPGSDKVHRLYEDGESQYLHEVTRETDFSKMNLLLRDFPKKGSHPLVQETISKFRDTQIDGGSIGTWMSRLWKGEIGACLLNPGKETPWDATPCLGISEKLGFVHLRPEGHSWVPYVPTLPRAVIQRNHISLVVHKSIIDHFI